MIKRYLTAAIYFVVALCAVTFAADDDIARLYTFAPGQTIQSAQINAEYNGIISALNGKMSRSGVNTITGNNTYSGTSAFTGVATFNAADLVAADITEKVGAAGVKILGTTSKLLVDYINPKTASGAITFGGAIIPSIAGNPGTPSEGMVYYDSVAHLLKYRDNSATQTVAASTTTPYPIGYHGSAVPVYATANTFTLAYLRERDSTDAVNITKATSTTVDISASGAAGRCDGVDANNTWFYLYAISKADGTTSACVSTTNELVSGTITLPTDYVYKRQMPFAARNNGSAALIEFVVAEGWPTRPKVIYVVSPTYYNGSYQVGVNNILNNGTSTSFASVAGSSFIPAISRYGIFTLTTANADRFTIIATGGSTNGIGMGGGQAFDSIIIPSPTNSSQSIDYKRNNGTGGVYIDVLGYVVTEVP